MTRRLHVLFLLVLLLAGSVSASYRQYEQVTVATTAIGFTVNYIVKTSGHNAAAKAFCRLEQAQIRYRVDGVAPTTTVGTILDVGDVLELTDSDAIIQFVAIRTGGTSGILNCLYMD